MFKDESFIIREAERGMADTFSFESPRFLRSKPEYKCLREKKLEMYE